ncbi:error-prone DNA polymerase [bacterium]|nr:error-prone DNA polymerase [bacterium]
MLDSRPDPQEIPSPQTRYVELHCRSNFSFLEGASHPDELVEQAVKLQLEGLAITDRQTLAGVVRGHVAAKQASLRIIIGAEILPVDAEPVVLWASDRASYGRLSQLITVGRRRAEKGACLLTKEDLAAHADGLLAGVVLHPGGSSLHDIARESLHFYRDVFGDRCYGLAELRRGDNDAASLARMKDRCKQACVPIVAAGDVHYHLPARRALQDVLTAIRLTTTIAQAGEHLFTNAERYLRSADQMLELFADLPEAVARTTEVADRCRFSLDELRYEYPEELCPAGIRPIEYLREITWRGAKKRYADGIPDRVRQLLEHELGLIEELRYEAYFLTVWDLVRFARLRGILCQGRGSAANSAVCFCLGVTSVDPDRFDVLFERFISRERQEAPDIDIDFEHQRREEVLQYIYDKYGRDRAGMTAEVITYQLRSAVRDIGKALGLSLDRVDALARSMDGFRGREPMELKERFAEAGLDAASRIGQQMLDLVPSIIDFPRHLSQHVGGMVITQGPLAELVPIENAAMENRTVIQWDKDDLDSLGILKVDCLALGMLSAIRRCLLLLDRHHQRRESLASIPADDPAVYDMICQADTIGVFQIESRAQMSMLPRLRPRCFYDLVIEVAIVRPGPIQGDMVHPYLRRRDGLEPVSYPSPACEEVLRKTLGVPLFQEQAMRLAVVGAGFTPGQADQLRRAMAAWRRPGVIDQFRQKLIDGFVARGVSLAMAERIFLQIRGFGEYGFPESHAASFALLVYVSAWLKKYYPAAFTASIINSLPMGFYAPAQLIRDARSHGVVVLPVDINTSQWECTLELHENSMALRLGLLMIQGIAQKDGERIASSREKGGPFRSMDELARRASLSRRALAALSAADACRSLSLDRRQALWNALPPREETPLFEHADDDDDNISLPPLGSWEQVVADYQTIGLSLRQHPISFIREELKELGVCPSRELATRRDRSWVKVAGLVLMRQQPSTAKGIRFVTLEDETGVANLVIRPNIWEKYRLIGVRGSSLLAGGTLERKGLVIHVLVSHLEDVSATIAGIRQKSRDFH